MKANELNSNEYNAYYSRYIEHLGETELVKGLIDSHAKYLEFFKSIPEDKLEYRYAEGKWTIKEIVLHLIDTERVFAYRAQRFGRKDTTPLSGFDQDDFVLASNANSRPLNNLLTEYSAVRQSSVQLFKNFNRAALLQLGEASGSKMSARAAGFMIIGHEEHHCKVIRERYL